MDTAAFHGFSLLCTPRVLTPRPATEPLVDRALERIGAEPARVADVGTGSGAIAVALGLLAPRAEIWATDTSAVAVELAAANAARFGLAGRLHIVEGDLLGPVPGELDLVVANLPYLPAREAREHPELEGEPLAALYAPGDGLGPLRRLFEQAQSLLRPDGAVIYQYRGEVYEAEAAELEERPALHQLGHAEEHLELVG
jgi:release factor glutamine methyltransferase